MRTMFIRVHVVLRDNIDFNLVIFSMNQNLFFIFKLRNEEKNVASGPECTSLTVDDDAYDGLFYR